MRRATLARFAIVTTVVFGAMMLGGIITIVGLLIAATAARS